MKPRPGRRPFLSILLAPVVLAAAVGAYFAFEGGGNAAAVADESANPCADGAEVEQAAFLVDLRKPIDPAHASLPGALLKNAAGEMQPGTELAVYALSPHAEAPRTLIGRVCKNVDLAGLATDAAKHRVADECDVPAQAPAALRAGAKDFCRQRDALARRVDALVVETLGRAAGATYLVEALEATARDFGEAPGSLYVFSDLNQHAAWFSHADRPPEQWNYDDMAEAWIEQPMAAPLTGFAPETTVKLHYVPRAGATEQEESQTAHKGFWERYFAGAVIDFDDQPVMTEYVPASLAEAPTAMELAAYELERLRHSQARIEEDRAAIERERGELAGERRRIEADRAAVAADRAAIARERLQLAAVRERLSGDPGATDKSSGADAAADPEARIAADDETSGAPGDGA